MPTLSDMHHRPSSSRYSVSPGVQYPDRPGSRTALPAPSDG